MCRLASMEFEADHSAPSEARQWIADVLEHWELPALSAMAMLLTSELVTNAIPHANSGAIVMASVADGSVEVGVTDGGPAPACTFRGQGRP
jgi:anti-sigma regulatory factor (Ser/Thr protein kinase)